MGATRTSPSWELALVEAVRGGEREACRGLVEGRRGELHAHRHRLPGSIPGAGAALRRAGPPPDPPAG